MKFNKSKAYDIMAELIYHYRRIRVLEAELQEMQIDSIINPAFSNKRGKLTP